jgi:hypothetical protein
MKYRKVSDKTRLKRMSEYLIGMIGINENNDEKDLLKRMRM